MTSGRSEVGSVSPAMAAVNDVLESARAMAGAEPSVRAVALVGSCARRTAGPESDVDLIILTTDVARLGRRRDWFTHFGSVELHRQRRFGDVAERRLRRPDGVEIEIGLASPAWAAVGPLDAGTARVVREGFAIVFDPDGLLARLGDAVQETTHHDH